MSLRASFVSFPCLCVYQAAQQAAEAGFLAAEAARAAAEEKARRMAYRPDKAVNGATLGMA